MHTAERKPVKVENIHDRRRNFKPKPPKRWSHHRELDDLKGKKIVIGFVRGSVHEVTVLESDPFTIKVRYTYGGTEQVIFKHAISDFSKVSGQDA